MKRETEYVYLKLANTLREQILSGYIKPGEFLMTEFDLAKHYGLSRLSVRKALDILVSENMIVKKVGSGTMVQNDLHIEKGSTKTLNIVISSPSFFGDFCLTHIIDIFEKEHPNVKVHTINLPGIMFWESVRNFERSGIYPDILLISDHQLKGMKYEYQYVKVDDYIANISEKIYPKLLHSIKCLDYRAVPVTFSPIFFAYNPRLFRKYNVPEPGDDWSLEVFLQTAKKLTLDTDNDGVSDLYGFSMSASITRWLTIAMHMGTDLSKIWAQPGILTETFDFLHKLLFKERIGVITSGINTNMGPFYNEKSAMTLTSTIELANWEKSQIPFNPKFAPSPFRTANASMLIANWAMIPSNSNSTEHASDFIKTMLSAPAQEEFCKKQQLLSVIKHVNDTVHSKFFLKALNIDSQSMTDSVFLHEIFEDIGLASELESEIGIFWNGLESVPSLIERINDVLTNQ